MRKVEGGEVGSFDEVSFGHNDLKSVIFVVSFILSIFLFRIIVFFIASLLRLKNILIVSWELKSNISVFFDQQGLLGSNISSLLIDFGGV